MGLDDDDETQKGKKDFFGMIKKYCVNCDQRIGFMAGTQGYEFRDGTYCQKCAKIRHNQDVDNLTRTRRSR